MTNPKRKSRWDDPNDSLGGKTPREVLREDAERGYPAREIVTRLNSVGFETNTWAVDKMRQRLGIFTDERGAPEIVSSEGVTVEDAGGGDEEEVLRRAIADYAVVEAVAERKEQQYIEFSHGPFGIAFVADPHFGGTGTDYKRAFDEAEIIRNTPGMYAAFVGDGINNFIVGRLMRLTRDQRLTITDEWTLLKRYLGVLAPKLRIGVGGNHDYWTFMVSGIDYLRDVIESIAPGCIYDTDDSLVDIRCAGVSWMARIRHKWQGSSIYNVTHGIERAAKWDQGFRLGVGAHTHRGGYARHFNVGGHDGMAVQVGTYKRFDAFARTVGFPRSNPSTAVVVVFDPETNSMTGFNSLHLASRFLGVLHGEIE